MFLVENRHVLAEGWDSVQNLRVCILFANVVVSKEYGANRHVDGTEIEQISLSEPALGGVIGIKPSKRSLNCILGNEGELFQARLSESEWVGYIDVLSIVCARLAWPLGADKIYMFLPI